MNGFIYKITNQVNNKVYIGQTRFTVEHRWKQHLRHFKSGRNTILYKAFKKYGVENFKVEPIEEVDVNSLDQREIFWIAKYDSFNSGYNATLGGSKGGIYIWTDSKYEEIRDLYLSGFTLKTIGEKFKVSSDTIRTILKSMNVKIRRQPFNINRIEKDLVIESYKNGTSLTSIAKQFNTDREAVKRFLIKEGVDLRDKSLLLKDNSRHKELIDDFLNGMRLHEMENKYHADQSTIKKILVINGINPKAKRGLKQSYKGAFCLTDSQCLECIKLYNEGMLMKDLARKFNINITTLYSLLDRYHIKKRYNSSKSVQVSK